MMVSKIVTHAALVVAQNKNDRVRVIGRGGHLKRKQHFPPASLSGSFANLPVTRFERRLSTAQGNCRLLKAMSHTCERTVTDFCLATEKFLPS